MMTPNYKPMTNGDLAFIVIISIVLVLSVLGNLMVLVVMIRTPKLMNATNLFICNVTVSDILLAGLVIPQNIHDISHAEDNYYEGDFLCRVVNFCPLLCVMASIYSMVAISFERKRAILVSNGARTTSAQAMKIIPLIWCLALVFCIPSIYEYSEFQELTVNGSVITRCGNHNVSNVYSTVNGSCILMLAYILPLSVLLFNYSCIIGFFRSRGIFNSTSIESVVTQAMYRSRYNVVKMMILISLLFCVSWMPYFVLLLIEKITGTSDVTDAESSVQMLRLALAVFSTVYNFLLNIIYNRNFRGGFQKFFVCARRVTRTNTIVPLEPGNTANLAGSSDIMVTPSAFVLSLQPRSATLA